MLLLAALGPAAQAAPPAPVVAALIEVLEPERAAELGPRPELQDVTRAVTPISRPRALAALARLKESGDATLLSEIARAYSLLGEGRAALDASDALRRARPGAQSEVAHALTLARAGDTQAAYAAAVELDKKYPGRSDVAALIAATKGRGGAAPAGEGPKTDAVPGDAVARSVSAQALPAMERAVAARQAGDLDAAWLHVQDAMRTDPASPIVQELYRAAEADRHRRLGPRAPAAGLAADLPREETPRPSGGLPLWPVVPATGLGAAAFVVARRARPFAADHDYEANDYSAGETERFIAGALLAGVAGGALYLGGAWLVGAAPAVMRAATSSSQLTVRLTQSQIGAINPSGVLRVGTTTLRLSQHAADQMSNRGLIVSQVESALKNPMTFEYFHEGVWKIGYYDPIGRIFLAQHQGTVTTVINNVKPQYIENLRKLKP